MLPPGGEEPDRQTHQTAEPETEPVDGRPCFAADHWTLTSASAIPVRAKIATNPTTNIAIVASHSLLE